MFHPSFIIVKTEIEISARSLLHYMMQFMLLARDVLVSNSSLFLSCISKPHNSKHLSTLPKRPIYKFMFSGFLPGTKHPMLFCAEAVPIRAREATRANDFIFCVRMVTVRTNVYYMCLSDDYNFCMVLSLIFI